MANHIWSYTSISRYAPLLLLIISFWKSSTQGWMNNKEDTVSVQNPKILNYKYSKIYIYICDRLDVIKREFYSNHFSVGRQLFIKDTNYNDLAMIKSIIHSQNDACLVTPEGINTPMKCVGCRCNA